MSEARFNTAGWVYGEDSISDLGQRIQALVPWHRIFADRGGKAFGLSLAQALTDGVFWVPPWKAMRSIDDEVPLFSRTIVRSNASDEDWGNAAAGLHNSKPAYNRDRMWDLVKELLGNCDGVVVQQLVDGVGLVLDLGWSELLQRNVLRVAIGVPSQEGGGYVYTSPTWDSEAVVGVFDAHTGEAIVDLQVHYFDVKRIVDKMVQRVIPRLIEWGITFGLQFEFMGSLYDDMDSLLQIRPSPGQLRGFTPTTPTKGQLLATTGKVNKTGEAIGETVWVDGHNDRRQPRQLHVMLADVGEYDSYNDGSLRQEFDGKIVVWNYDALQRYGYSMWQVLGAWKVGAAAQIAGRALFINSAHGTRIPLWNRMKDQIDGYAQAKQGGPLLAIGHEVLRDLVQHCHNNPITLHVVSDGLVGQVYKL